MSNRTPAEWARFLAEKVMGWKRYTKGAGRFTTNYYLPPDRATVMVEEAGATGWSPWHNPADALEVLGRLRENYRHKRSDTLPKLRIERDGKVWTVAIGLIVWAEDMSGNDHYGPAVCLLAEKILSAQSAEKGA